MAKNVKLRSYTAIKTLHENVYVCIKTASYVRQSMHPWALLALPVSSINSVKYVGLGFRESKKKAKIRKKKLRKRSSSSSRGHKNTVITVQTGMVLIRGSRGALSV